MKNKYEKMQDFVNDLMTPEMIKERRENFRDLQGDMDTEFCIWEFQRMVKDIRRNSYDYKDVDPPFEVPQYTECVDTDHDHGAWTDEYIIKTDERYYPVRFDYYGQFDFDKDTSKYNSVEEAVPVEVTVTKYVKKETI